MTTLTSVYMPNILGQKTLFSFIPLNNESLELISNSASKSHMKPSLKKFKPFLPERLSLKSVICHSWLQELKLAINFQILGCSPGV